MEKDDEVKNSTGTSYDFGSRSIYDGRIARFVSIDPRWREFAWVSPYAFAINNPLRFIDEDGEGPGQAIELPLPSWDVKGLLSAGIDPTKIRVKHEKSSIPDLAWRGSRYHIYYEDIYVGAIDVRAAPGYDNVETRLRVEARLREDPNCEQCKEWLRKSFYTTPNTSILSPEGNAIADDKLLITIQTNGVDGEKSSLSFEDMAELSTIEGIGGAVINIGGKVGGEPGVKVAVAQK